MKRIIGLILFFCGSLFLIGSCSKEVVKSAEINSLTSGSETMNSDLETSIKNKIEVVIISNDLEVIAESVYKKFIVVLRTDLQEKDELLLTCDDEIINYRYGNLVIDISDRPPLFGYRTLIQLDEETGAPNSILLDPLFGDGSNVGDTITLEWNSDSRTFYKPYIAIP